MTRPPRPSPPYFLIGLVSWPLLHSVFRFRAYGKEHLPVEGGYVLAAGHHSNLDPWAIGLPLWPRRFLRFMAKSELFWFPLGTFIRACGAFKVRRGKADAEAIQTAVNLARTGNVIAMFPEGTRRKKGLMKTRQPQSHTGAARIALEAGVPLVPGRHPRHRRPRASRRLARPLRRADSTRRPGCLEPAEAARVATERVMASIRELEESL